MLSVSSSFIATNCCDLIFCASLALIGGRAEESTTAPCPGCLGGGSRAEVAWEVRLAAADIDGTTVGVADTLEVNTGRPARDAAGGKTPRGVSVAPAGEQPHS